MTDTTNTLKLVNEYLMQGGYSPGIDADALDAESTLIAAAPELLAVLQEAVNKGYMWDSDPELWSKASAVITKAKGE